MGVGRSFREPARRLSNGSGNPAMAYFGFRVPRRYRKTSAATMTVGIE